MLNTPERHIAQHIYNETSSLDLAVTAVVLRRLIPRLQMNSADLAGLFIVTSEAVEAEVEMKE